MLKSDRTDPSVSSSSSPATPVSQTPVSLPSSQTASSQGRDWSFGGLTSSVTSGLTSFINTVFSDPQQNAEFLPIDLPTSRSTPDTSGSGLSSPIVQRPRANTAIPSSSDPSSILTFTASPSLTAQPTPVEIATTSTDSNAAPQSSLQATKSPVQETEDFIRTQIEAARNELDEQHKLQIVAMERQYHERLEQKDEVMRIQKAKIQELGEEIVAEHATIQTQKLQIEQLTDQNNEQAQKLQQQTINIDKQNQTIRQLMGALQEQSACNQLQEAEIAKLTNTLSERETEIKALKSKQVSIFEPTPPSEIQPSAVPTDGSKVGSSSDLNTTLNQELAANNQELANRIEELQVAIQQRDAFLDQLAALNEAQKQELQQMKAKMDQQVQSIKTIMGKIQDQAACNQLQEVEITRLTNTLKEREAEINDLKPKSSSDLNPALDVLE